VFAGHVTWHGRAVFWDLDKLQPGDIIKLMGEDGTELVYAVSNSFLVDPADPESLKVMQGTATDIITVITCGGDFVDTNDPVFGGEYTGRRIVRAELVSVTTVGAPAASNAPAAP
jgi:LPXTG-site transpeptidase (sortase) family protein